MITSKEPTYEDYCCSVAQFYSQNMDKLNDGSIPFDEEVFDYYTVRYVRSMLRNLRIAFPFEEGSEPTTFEKVNEDIYHYLLICGQFDKSQLLQFNYDNESKPVKRELKPDKDGDLAYPDIDFSMNCYYTFADGEFGLQVLFLPENGIYFLATPNGYVIGRLDNLSNNALAAFIVHYCVKGHAYKNGYFHKIKAVREHIRHTNPKFMDIKYTKEWIDEHKKRYMVNVDDSCISDYTLEDILEY